MQKLKGKEKRSKEMMTNEERPFAIEKVCNRKRLAWMTLSRILIYFNGNGNEDENSKLNHILLRLLYFALKKYAETKTIKNINKKNKLINSKVFKLLHMLAPNLNMSMDYNYFFTLTRTESLILNGLLGKKRRKNNKLEYKTKIKAKKSFKLPLKLSNENDTNYDKERQLEADLIKDFILDIVSSIVNKSIYVLYRNNIEYDKPFQSLTPTFSIKNFSFGILSPLSSSSSLYNQQMQIVSTPVNKQSYPLTSTHLNAIHSHIMIVNKSNINSYSNSSMSTNSNSNYNSNHPKLFPFNIFSKQNPYVKNPPYTNLDHSSSESFYIKLTKDIYEFTQSMDYYNALLYEAKIKVIEIVKAISYESLQCNNILISFELFGSFANGLSLDTSDIDILIKYNSNQHYEAFFIQLLQVSFKTSGLFSLVFPIPSAKIPVIKLIAPLAAIIPEDNVTIIKKQLPEIDSISIDIIFANVYFSSYLPSLEIVHYIKNAIALVPSIKGIMLFLKKVLIKKKLNSYYNGGLSSFSLFILLLALIKYRSLYGTQNIKNCAYILMHFLDFYSKFNFDLYGVNINLSFSYGFLGPNAINTPMIIDPITNLNIGAGTFKIDNIKKCFEELIADLKKLYGENKSNGNIITMILGM